jgi:hypothetical protein
MRGRSATCFERCDYSRRVQVMVLILKLWTYSMRSRETGALQFSVRLEVCWPPHRCQIKDSRSSLVVKVCRVTGTAIIVERLQLCGVRGKWGG